MAASMYEILDGFSLALRPDVPAVKVRVLTSDLGNVRFAGITRFTKVMHYSVVVNGRGTPITMKLTR